MLTTAAGLDVNVSPAPPIVLMPKDAFQEPPTSQIEYWIFCDAPFRKNTPFLHAGKVLQLLPGLPKVTAAGVTRKPRSGLVTIRPPLTVSGVGSRGTVGNESNCSVNDCP